MDLPTESEEVSAQMYNNYCCRFCVYDANGSLDCLQAHYTEHHPVTVEKIGEERIDYYQAGQLIALLSKNHKHCCFENCPNNQTLTLRKNLFKLAVQLKYGGLYPQLTPFFDEEHYNTEPHVFSCCDLFHHSKFYSSDVLLRWITQYGLIRTFSLKDVVKKKNKNLLLLQRVPKVKNQAVEQINKIVSEMEEKEIKAQLCQVVSVGLVKSVQIQAKVIQGQFLVEKKEKDQFNQLKRFVREMGFDINFDSNNKLMIDNKLVVFNESEEVKDENRDNKKRKIDEELTTIYEELETIMEAVTE